VCGGDLLDAGAAPVHSYALNKEMQNAAQRKVRRCWLRCAAAAREAAAEFLHRPPPHVPSHPYTPAHLPPRPSSSDPTLLRCLGGDSGLPEPLGLCRTGSMQWCGQVRGLHQVGEASTYSHTSANHIKSHVLPWGDHKQWAALVIKLTCHARHAPPHFPSPLSSKLAAGAASAGECAVLVQLQITFGAAPRIEAVLRLFLVFLQANIGE